MAVPSSPLGLELRVGTREDVGSTWARNPYDPGFIHLGSLSEAKAGRLSTSHKGFAGPELIFKLFLGRPNFGTHAEGQ